ncbi:nicotinate-nucleotide--dimethylbenzimidazole phosphoribosyltransferase [Thetidibacter halocola]|uniref:Nicotinate-nucleotide--dimethylbenzimidazole phosphoribosyltransferase n=1 Tax=Thetidibacter halocola TaxID=2827239 RepID=A0A8J7W8G4_9RHOB|nr:nicotinate-nucleotide--dimethylbenzimidazole phosphoribosyltransferase [Thetidibacter halocola]
MSFEDALKSRMERAVSPPGALGRLERLAAQVARLQGRLDPVMRQAALIVLAADHGIAEAGVSGQPLGAARHMLAEMARGQSATTLLARENGLDLRLVNAGLRGGAGDLPGIEDLSLGEGTANCLRGPAMSRAQLDRALAQGRALGASGRADAVAFGEIAGGSSSSAALIVHRLTGVALQQLIGRGAGLSDEGLMHKHDILSRASDRVSGALGPEAALMEFGGFEIAMMTGAIIGAAAERRIVLIDGFIPGAAALAAAQMVPATREAMVFCQLSREPGHRVLLEVMGAQPILSLDIALGAGAGAALAWPILRAAVAVLNAADAPAQSPDRRA